MLPPKPHTSRDTRFTPAPPPDKHRLRLDEMLHIAHEAGRGQTIREIATATGRSPTTVSKYVKIARNSFVLERPINSKAYYEQVIRHFIIYSLIANPASSGHAMSEQLQVIGVPASRAKVNRIAQDLNFISVLQQKQEMLTDEHRKRRVEFAKNVVKWFGFCLPWVFSDESMIVRNPEKKKIRIIRGLLTRERFAELEGYPVKIMVWACIGTGFKSHLILVEGTLTADSYIELLKTHRILEALDERYGRLGYVWQQDGARPHTAKVTKQFLQDRVMRLPDHLAWPARSPDLSVIENFWQILKSQMRYDSVFDRKSLFAEASRVWDTINIESVNRAVNDFPARLATCKAIKGRCLNEYRPILAGFRVGRDKGYEVLRTTIDNETRVTEFKNRSTDFFSANARAMTPKTVLTQLPDGLRSDAIERNRVIAEESRAIVQLLPQPYLKRLGISNFT